jgi:hypothetical protein
MDYEQVVSHRGANINRANAASKLDVPSSFETAAASAIDATCIDRNIIHSQLESTVHHHRCSLHRS